jgi:HK97 family phage portal protein
VVAIINAITNVLKAIKAMAKGDLARRFQYLSDYEYERNLVTPSDLTSQLEAYRSWVYVCASKNAISLASFPLKLYVAKPSKSKLLIRTKSISKETRKHLYSIAHLDSFLNKAVEIEEVLEHPFLNMMKNVNPFTNSFELKEITDIHQELTGNSYWYIISNYAGMPVELWIIPPDKMRIIPSKEEFISGYLYNAMPNSVAFTKEQIIHFKFSSPLSPYYGLSPLAAITHAYNINENMNRYENALFTNMGRPDGVLETEDFLNDDDFKKLKKEWKQTYGRVKNSGKTAVLDMGVHYKPISFPPRELSFLAGRKTTKEEICNAFGQSLALYDKDANRANADNATYMHMRDTISPRHRRMEQKINEQVMGRYDERLFCVFENCVPEDKAFAHKVRIESVDKIITRNEIRHEIGKEDIEGGDTLYQEGTQIPLGMTPEKEIEEVSMKIAKKVKEKIDV